jgi:competence protein ComEA
MIARMMRVFSCAWIILAASPAFAQQAAADHPGKALLARVCGSCHGVESITEHPRTKADWSDTLEEMIRYGAQASDQEFEHIFDYLLRNYSLINVNKALAADLEVALDVSEKVARAIVEYRDANGTFKTIDDVKKVPGVDAEKLEARAGRLRY